MVVVLTDATRLAPHESPTTDVVLLGHSMGGIMSAEAVLLPAENPADISSLQHCVLGTINFDTPFLGMHPGIITSGISSLFRSAPIPPKTPSNSTPLSPQPSNTSTVTLSSTASAMPLASPLGDSYYNTAFPNDKHLPVRSGWESALHFLNKHSTDLRQATKQLITSHVEFGSCLADYEGLKIRYCKVRMLEEQDKDSRQTVIGGNRWTPRVRFVNYYTASTGRSKKPKIAKDDALEKAASQETKGSAISLEGTSISGSQVSLFPPETVRPNAAKEPSQEEAVSQDTKGPSINQNIPTTSSPDGPHSPSGSAQPSLAVRDVDDNLKDFGSESSLSDLNALDPIPHDEDSLTDATPGNSNSIAELPLESSTTPESTAVSLNTHPQVPEPGPPPLATDFPNDKYAYKLAQKDWQRNVSWYHRQIKDLRKAERDRSKYEAKRASDVRKAEIKRDCEAKKEDRKRALEALKESKRLSKEEERQNEDMLKKEKKKSDNAAKENPRRAEELEKEQRKKEERKGKLQQTVETAGSMNESLSRSFTTASNVQNGSTQAVTSPEAKDLKQDTHKERKFCILPPKDRDGNRDPTWVRVYMAGVDEVGAHCGLFFPIGPGEEVEDENDEPAAGGDPAWGQRYATLVGDVAERIETWVHESMTERLIEQTAQL